MRIFTLYLLFLIIAALILSFAFIPRQRGPATLIVREPAADVVPVRRLTYNPWLTEPATTLRMEKPSYDLRDGMTF